MLLSELTKVHLPTSERDDEELLKQHGFQPLDSGGYSSIYKNPAYPFVLKVFETRDIGYLTFLRYCLQNKGNVNLPVFRGRVKSISDQYKICRLEKLEKAPHVVRRIFTYLGGDVRRALMLKRDLRSTVSDCLSNIDLDTDENLVTTIVALAELARSGGIQFDLNGDNIMMRGSTVVIIDPFLPPDDHH